MSPSNAAREALVAVVLCVSAAVASAAPLTFPGIPAATRQTFRYACEGGETFEVSYWNTANGQSFALVPVKGRRLLFVNTIAGSGARYQADRYTWWTKGPRADLYDATGGENAPPIVAGCVEQH